jgi:hypothetical protein
VSTVEWVSIPLSEFENLHEHIRILQERVKKLEVELAGIYWGMSNAESEQHALSEEHGIGGGGGGGEADEP